MNGIVNRKYMYSLQPKLRVHVRLSHFLRLQYFQPNQRLRTKLIYHHKIWYIDYILKGKGTQNVGHLKKE